MASDKGSSRVAVVTGSSRGLGAAMAARLAADGFVVVVNHRNSAAEGEKVVKGIAEAGGRAVQVQGDVSTVAGVRAFWAAVDRALDGAVGHHRVDVLVANAGIIVNHATAEATEDEFDALFNTNVKGVFFLVQEGLRRLNDGGRIITLGSGLSRVANPRFAAYSATKGAVDVLTRVWAQELGPRGITVNTLAPGPIDTDMNPWLRTQDGAAMASGNTALRRVGHAEDIADAVSFLAGPDSRWVTAQRVEASGGYHL